MGARRAIALTALLLFASPRLASARHGAELLLDPRRATPGIRLELVELPDAQPRGAAARYGVRASGVPRNATFGVWAKEFGGQFHEVLGGFRADDTGALIRLDSDGRAVRLADVVLEPGPYPSGAAWEVALVSDDKTVTSFARVIPRPIEARAGRCTVSLELVSRRGDRFLASGSGFAPGEDVIIESQGAGRTIQRRQRVGADGQLPPDVVWHRPGDARSARYAVRSGGCDVAVSYEWGEAVLSQR